MTDADDKPHADLAFELLDATTRLGLFTGAGDWASATGRSLA